MLNAFRHQGGRHAGAIGIQWVVAGVLNAFRHQGGRHDEVVAAEPEPEVCSTPFGISDEDTSPASTATSTATCAQRLSASVMKTPKLYSVEHSLHWCSTPFGISDEDTGWPEKERGSAVVLNAFRHQGGRHVVAYTDVGSLRECSTPFGISDEDTIPPAVRLGRAFWPVLNAFRHQGGRHRPSLLSGRCSWSAQRLSASVMKTRLGTWKSRGLQMCSTPFGISDEDTDGIVQGGIHFECAQRLSASVMKTQ